MKNLKSSLLALAVATTVLSINAAQANEDVYNRSAVGNITVTGGA